MSKEAMKLALEALENINNADNDRDFLGPEECCDLDNAITALREALAEQPAQHEPVAYGMWDTMLGKGNRMMMVRLDKGQDGCTVPLYTSPPAQRTWVGLTDEEIEARAINFYNPEMYKRAVLWAQEKLKERNQ